MCIDTKNMQLSSIDSISMDSIDDIEKSASDEKRQNEILIQHILLSMHTQATVLSKESIDEAVSSSSTVVPSDLTSSSSLKSSSSVSGLSSAKGTASRGSIGAYGLPTLGSSASSYPFTGDPKKDYETFIKIISDKRRNFTDIRKAEAIVDFLIQFADTYSTDPAVNSAEMKQMITTYMEIIIASAYINGNEQDAKAAIDRIESKFLGDHSQAMKNAIAEFNSAHKDQVQFYIDTYSVIDFADPTKKKKMSQKTFESVSGGQMAFCAINTLGILSHLLYKSLIAEVMKDAAEATMKGHKNIQLIYLQLLNIIRSKEGDAEDEIAGTANMLKQLGLGETSTGDAEDAISKIISLSTGDQKELAKYLKIINDNLDFFKSKFEYAAWTPAAWTSLLNDLKKQGVSIGSVNAFNDLAQILHSIESPADWSKLSPDQQNRIINDLNTIKQDTNPKKSLIWSESGIDIKEENLDSMIKAIDDYKNFKMSPESRDAAKQLAQALLDLREMGLYFDGSIFPGLKEITAKLLGDEKGAGGDFFSITKLDLNTLQLAANGDEAAQEKVAKAIEALKPESATSEISPLSTITNEINHIATFFNDRNNEEQAQAQFLSSNDEKILAFIKEMQDFPVNFEKAILQNIQRSGQ